MEAGGELEYQGVHLGGARVEMPQEVLRRVVSRLPLAPRLPCSRQRWAAPKWLEEMRVLETLIRVQMARMVRVGVLLPFHLVVGEAGATLGE